eukprot:5910623-Alexandrium_andersonii.AAC.1
MLVHRYQCGRWSWWRRAECCHNVKCRDFNQRGLRLRDNVLNENGKRRADRPAPSWWSPPSCFFWGGGGGGVRARASGPVGGLEGHLG